jgi:hypothetical protein
VVESQKKKDVLGNIKMEGKITDEIIKAFIGVVSTLQNKAVPPSTK